jgi:hypothetical protein
VTSVSGEVYADEGLTQLRNTCAVPVRDADEAVVCRGSVWECRCNGTVLTCVYLPEEHLSHTKCARHTTVSKYV